MLNLEGSHRSIKNQNKSCVSLINIILTQTHPKVNKKKPLAKTPGVVLSQATDVDPERDQRLCIYHIFGGVVN